MTRRRLRWRLLALLLSFGLIAAACGDDDGGDTGGAEDTTTTTSEAPADDGGDGTETTTTVAEEEEEAAPACDATVPGSELNFAVYVPTNSLDPLQSSAALTGGTDLAAIYDVLTRWNPDTGDWEMHAAESLESNDDYTEWTLTLREGITYSDGSPMLAQHVYDNLVRMTGPGRNASRGFLERVDFENSEVVDERTVIFRLFSPWVKFAYVFGDAPGMVVNPAVAANAEATPIDSIAAEGAGAGPYVVERWAPGESPYLVLKARDDYWGGPVCIETVNLISIPTDDPKFDALETGEIDVAFMRTQDVIEAARDTGEYGESVALQSAGILILINNSKGTPNPITADVRFREAVNLALDPDQISQAAYGGQMLQQSGLLHEDSMFWTDEIEGIPADPDRAAQLVEELKAEGWDGSIRLICPNTSPDTPVAVEAALEAVGMNVDTNISDTNTHIAEVVINSNFDLSCWGWNISDSAVWRQMDFNFRSDSTSNRIGYANPEMDAAIDALFRAETPEEEQAAMADAARIYNTDFPSAIIGAVEEGIFFREGVNGIKQTQQTVFLLDDAYIDE